MEWRPGQAPRTKALDDACDLETLLHPGQAFDRPADVVKDPDLTLDEKRAILASWASDACALDAVPILRQAPGARHPVHFDEIMEALRTLDAVARQRAPRSAGAARRRRDDPHSGTPEAGGHPTR